MRFLASLVMVLLGSITLSAQSSIEELPKGHAIAVADYLAANKDVRFRQQHRFSADYQKFITEELGKGFRLSYAAGDFNGDKVEDFAILFLRDGEPEASGATSEEHSTDFPLRSRKSHTSIGVKVLAGPRLPAYSPAITRSDPASPGKATLGMSSPRIAW